ncbi:MAG: hypothetical protein ACHQ51_05730 [Elusimicrobiota bacterium]
MSTLLIFLLGAPLLLLGIAPAAALWRRRGEKRTVHRRAPAPPLIMPTAEETAASIERFRDAVRRFRETEAAWESERIRALTGHDGGGILRRRRPRRTSR